jgi:hypothetical protein
MGWRFYSRWVSSKLLIAHGWFALLHTLLHDPGTYLPHLKPLGDEGWHEEFEFNPTGSIL